ncbi:MAG TPA: baseplate J/gp47 family protein, partial [Acetobacteraceae bacterium]
MPFQRPNLPQLIQQFWAYAVALLPGADASLRRSNLKVLSRAVPGLINGEYGYMDWGWRQVFASSAESGYLDVQGAEYNLPRLGAAQAGGNALFTGTDGSDVPEGTLLQDASAVQFVTLADATISGSTPVAVQAVVG